MSAVLASIRPALLVGCSGIGVPSQMFPGLCGCLLWLTHFPLLHYRGHLTCGSGWLDWHNPGWILHRGVLGDVEVRAFDLVVSSELLVLVYVFVLFYFYVVFIILK